MGEQLVNDIYHKGNRELQDQFDSLKLADRLNEIIVHDNNEIIGVRVNLKDNWGQSKIKCLTKRSTGARL